MLVLYDTEINLKKILELRKKEASLSGHLVEK